MYSEITKELFLSIFPVSYLVYSSEYSELCSKVYYKKHDVLFLVLTNYLSGVVQYYVQDINA